MAAWVALIIILSLVSRFLGKKFGWRAPTRPQPPSLAEITSEAIDEEALLTPRVFRRRHFLQTFVLSVLGIAILASFFATLAQEGWGLLTLLLIVAEIFLIFAHGTPLLLSMSRTLTISEDGFAVRELVSRRSMKWWEVRRFTVVDDLTRFRAEGLHRQLTYETSGFPSDTKREIYRTVRAHLARHQLPLEGWNQGPALVRFFRQHALGLMFLGVIVAGALIAESEFDVTAEKPVLGFTCATATKYLRERHGLPDVPGCVILRVNLETSAYRERLQTGDMIVALAGTPITSEEQLTRYFHSLDDKGDDFSVIKAGETQPTSIKVRPGSPGRIPLADTESAYTHYLRARDDLARREAIREYTLAIELAPQFDAAYVQRGKAYGEKNGDEQAAADLDKAIELDPKLATAYRERATLDLHRDNDATQAYLRKAMELDNCETGFKDHNYDCYMDHLLAANAYGGTGESEGYTRATAEAIEAIGFYPEMPNAHYLAAYYLWNLGREEEARDYAAAYIQIAEKADEPPWHLEWAKRVVSGTNAYAERMDQSHEYQASVPAEAFITESEDGDLIPDGPPVVNFVTFAEERTLEEPPGRLSVTFDRPRVWAYFTFDNAAGVQDLTWAWSQNGFAYGGGQQTWPGTNKGTAWIQLENQLPGEPSQNILTISFDYEEIATATLHIGDDAYVGPLRFYRDAETRDEILFYDGQPSLVYAIAQYASFPVGTTLSWTAERNGVRIASGSFDANETAQTVLPIALPEGLEPGVIDVYVFLGGQLARKGVLVVAPAAAVSSPPFQSFALGTGFDHEEGISPTKAKELFANEGALGYVIESASLAPGSLLSVRWMKDGKPLGPAPEEIGEDDLYAGYYEGYPFSLDDPPLPGEYEVIVAMDGQPVYGNVIVIK